MLSISSLAHVGPIVQMIFVLRVLRKPVRVQVDQQPVPDMPGQVTELPDS